MKKVTGISFAFLLALAAAAGSNAYAADNEYNEDTAATVNALVERAVDGQKGYQEAAEQVTSADLKSRFTKTSAERAQFAADLRAKVIALGEDAEKGGSLEGTMHRAWIDVKSAVVPNDDKAVLEAVKTGESIALEDFRKASEKDLPQDIHSLVHQQHDAIQSSYDWVVNRLNEEVEKTK